MQVHDDRCREGKEIFLGKVKFLWHILFKGQIQTVGCRGKNIPAWHQSPVMGCWKTQRLRCKWQDIGENTKDMLSTVYQIRLYWVLSLPKERNNQPSHAQGAPGGPFNKILPTGSDSPMISTAMWYCPGPAVMWATIVAFWEDISAGYLTTDLMHARYVVYPLNYLLILLWPYF